MLTEINRLLKENWIWSASNRDQRPFLRFEQRGPSPQTAIDLFRHRWAGNLNSLLGVDGTGSVPFEQDDRPFKAARSLGDKERLEGFSVLELGPLEGAHSYGLERLGAHSIIAVESNGEAYLKCLVVKELLNLQRTNYLFGDVVEFLDSNSARFDLVFCSGILYHMVDPLRLIEAICAVTDRCFVWTHYYDPGNKTREFAPSDARVGDFSATYWTHEYGSRSGLFWGGNKSKAVWLERDTIFQAFAHFGLTEVCLVEEHPDHVNGPSITMAVRRADKR